MAKAPLQESALQIEVTVFVCPDCLEVGRKDDRCAHYAGGSVGWIYLTRQPATLLVAPVGWTPAHHEPAPVIP